MLTSKRKEKISAFLDNNMYQDELMSFSLSAEADDAAVAQRYQLVGEVLRDEMSDASFIDVSQAVRAALANENIADQLSSESLSATRADVKTATALPDSASAASVSKWSLSSLFRPVAGLAVAASVAVVMVVSVNQQENNSMVPLASNTGSAPALQFAAGDKTSAKGLNSIAVNYQDSVTRPKVNPRLVNQHLEFATQDTLQSRLPYVRAVSFEAEK